ncbi:MAG: hypothetical protein JO031_07540, partial [Ktedonobacteraceae bacterium]|nr:hypothetical protein [Ktedonobacteraceae bacterium]
DATNLATQLKNAQKDAEQADQKLVEALRVANPITMPKDIADWVSKMPDDHHDPSVVKSWFKGRPGGFERWKKQSLEKISQGEIPENDDPRKGALEALSSKGKGRSRTPDMATLAMLAQSGPSQVGADGSSIGPAIASLFNNVNS